MVPAYKIQHLTFEFELQYSHCLFYRQQLLISSPFGVPLNNFIPKEKRKNRIHHGRRFDWAPRKRKFDDEIDVSSDLSAAVSGPAATIAKEPKLVEDVNTQLLDEFITTGEGDSDKGGTITGQNYRQPAVSDAEESDIGMSEFSEIMFDDEDDGLEDEHSYEDEDDCEDSDSEPHEYAVEERQIIVQKDGTDKVVRLRLFMTKEEESENWLQTIHVACTIDGQRIGYAFGRYIHQEKIREHFWSEMEAPCSDMS